MATFIARFEPAATAKPGALRLAVKDLIDMTGTPTTNGSKVVAASAGGGPATTDPASQAGAREAEAKGEVTIVGKANLHELAFGVTGINPWFGTPVNPIDPRLVPGGSSSGSAVAVGTGEADIAYGSDTGGSIRVPAACCGVVGLKTTRGRVSLEGVRPLAPSLDTVGPMAATVDLTARGMALLEPGFAVAGKAAESVGRMRLPADEHINVALDAALHAAGLAVVDVELPGWDAVTSSTMTILMAEAWQVHAELWRHHASELSPDVSARLEEASQIRPEEVAACWEQAREWVARLSTLFTRVEVLALPTLASEPPTIENAARLSDMRHVAPFNVTGIPALSMPVSTPGKYPASLQLAGPARSEEILLATAAAVEAAAPWKRHR
jgi:amidase